MDQNKGAKNKEEMLIYLDFHDKIPKEFLENKMFIRIVDLQSSNPLIQINDMVFKGTYSHSMGTNMFFQRSPNQDSDDNPFITWTANNLEVNSIQTKTISCKKMCILPRKIEIPENTKAIKYNLKLDYKKLLNQFENITLHLQEMIDLEPQAVEVQRVPIEEKVEEKKQEENICDKPDVEEHKVDVRNEEASKQIELRHAYLNLQKLARKPLKRRMVDENVNCEDEYKKSFDYKNIECKVIERPFFSYFQDKSNNTSNVIDIEGCVRHGLLKPSKDIPRILSEDEESQVLKIDNLDYLDLEARLSIFSSYVEQMEKQIQLNSAKQNNLKDIYGNTPLETLEIYKNLVSALQKRICEIKSIEVEE